MPPQESNNVGRRKSWWLFWTGGSLLFIAAGFIGWSYLRNRSLEERWVPLEVPISMETGSITTPEFHPVLETDYLIYIEVERKIEFERLNCLLGLETINPLEQCKDTPELIDVSWTLNDGGRTIAKGRSQDYRAGFYSDTIAREIGEFRGGKGRVATIRATINRDASELNGAKPKILVSVDPSEWKDDVVAQQLDFFTGCVFGLLGVAATLLGGILEFRRRRSRSP